MNVCSLFMVIAALVAIPVAGNEAGAGGGGLRKETKRAEENKFTSENV